MKLWKRQVGNWSMATSSDHQPNQQSCVHLLDLEFKLEWWDWLQSLLPCLECSLHPPEAPSLPVGHILLVIVAVMDFLASCFLFMFMGIFSGYFGGRLYKTVRGQNWKSAAFWTSLLYPGVVFGTCFFLNFFIWGQKSSGAVPFTTMIAILCMWMGVSLPLVFTGYYFGYRKRLNLVENDMILMIFKNCQKI